MCIQQTNIQYSKTLCKLDLGEAYNHVKLEISYTCWNDEVFGPKGEGGSTLALIIRFPILADGSPSRFFASLQSQHQGDPFMCDFNGCLP